MNPDWQTFLTESGAFSPAPATALPNGFCALPDQGLLRIHGEDARTFLQGQTTCDIAALAPGRSRLGAFCTVKGRVLANFHVFRSGEAYYLLLPAELAEPLAKRLRLYVLRSKVAIEDLTPARGFIGLFGTGAPADSGIDWPESESPLIERADHLVFGLGEQPERCLVAAEPATARRLWSCLEADPGFTRTGPEAWTLKDIEAGLPTVTQAVSEEFLPQMLNLDLLGGIGFKKGCYTGQEVVARTHYLGNLKRRMFRLRGPGGVEVRAGDAVFEAGDADGNIGQVVMAAPESGGTSQLLAVLNLEHARAGDLRLHRKDGPKAEVLPLPYAFETSA
jgi:folate-binding protein YgfZ